MIATSFFNDFIEYYNKANILEQRNSLLLPEDTTVGDPLMDSVTIYDTVHRKQAGFSKVLEDIHGVRLRKDLVRLPDFTETLNIQEFHFLHLLHRFTGSGASFQPRLLPDGSLNPKEHGYCNNIVYDVAQVMTMDSFEGARLAIVNNVKPMVTSTGNQPPSLKNGNPSKYRLAQQYYFDNFAEQFVKDYVYFLKNFIEHNLHTCGIKEAVDFCLKWHKDRGFKQWHFVLTAFVMDTAEYYPDLVDPNSHCYYGANCIRSFDLMFVKEPGVDKEKGNDWYEKCMSVIVEVTGGRPYDLEDVACDYIRYVTEYIPKGYKHLTQEQKLNNSTLKVETEHGLDYPTEIIEWMAAKL